MPHRLPRISHHIDIDIFCTVIDNFGDIGVAWRLAQQLQHEHQQQVRLWVDELSALARLYPHTSNESTQHLLGIYICLWNPKTFPTDVIPARVVIEAFGCTIPETYRQSMRHYRPHWFNLEYLSAEDWVIDCHLMPSLQSDGLRKYFFMPSIRHKTGGLLREQHLIAKRDEFINNKKAQQEWCQRYTIPIPSDMSISISLFGYENAHTAELIDYLSTSSPFPITLYLPESKILHSVATAIKSSLTIGDSYQQGCLTVHVIPFLPQAEYDRLLWLCDLNFVRGEDSLVRAIWAGKPFVWHIYPTEDNAHLEKLSAFLQHYFLEDNANDPLVRLIHAWNQNSDLSVASNSNLSVRDALTDLFAQFTQVCANSHNASHQQIIRPNLCDQLIQQIDE